MGPAAATAVAFLIACAQGVVVSHGSAPGGGDGAPSPPPVLAVPKSYEVTVVNRLPHRDKPFTQGLEMGTMGQYGQILIETSGAYPPGTQSFIRGVDPRNGEVLWTSTAGLGDSFVEGITQLGPDGHWYASVYQTPRRLLEYDANMQYVRDLPYYFDGWGLTRNRNSTAFLATNGSAYIMTLDTEDVAYQDSTPAMCLGHKVPGLNELEMVDDFLGGGPALLGNVYFTRVVLVLHPDSMECLGAFRLDGLEERVNKNEKFGYHVANGIAYDKHTGHLFVTGKNWDSMFEVSLRENSTDTSAFDLLGTFLEAKASGVLTLAQIPSIKEDGGSVDS